jgi:hypothetical protein
MHIDVARNMLSFFTTPQSYYALQSDSNVKSPFYWAAFNAKDDMIQLSANSGAESKRCTRVAKQYTWLQAGMLN